MELPAIYKFMENPFNITFNIYPKLDLFIKVGAHEFHRFNKIARIDFFNTKIHVSAPFYMRAAKYY